MSSTWDTLTDSQEFFDAYMSYMGNKSGGTWNLLQQDSQTRWWDTAGQSVYLEQQGQNVLIMIATDETIISAALPAFS